jgi:hypothetical protein
MSSIDDDRVATYRIESKMHAALSPSGTALAKNQLFPGRDRWAARAVFAVSWLAPDPKDNGDRVREPTDGLLEARAPGEFFCHLRRGD